MVVMVQVWKISFKSQGIRKVLILGRRDGAVVTALAYNQCGPSSIPGLGFICGFSVVSWKRCRLRLFELPMYNDNQ